MAKKTLTPEQAEIKAMKKEKSSQNWTKFWAIVLAAALTFGVVFLGKSQADKAIEEAGANDNAVVDNNDAVDNNDDSSMFGDDTSSNNDATNNDASSNDATNNDASNNDATNNDASNNNATNNDASNNNASNNTQQSSQPTKADVAKAYNEATAKAAKASYNWKRTGEFTQDIALSPSWATGMVDGIIKAVDKNASLNSVVGGFLGIGNKEAEVVKGAAPEGMDAKYLIKAGALTADDIQSCKVEGNKYMIQVKNCQNPDKGSAMDHATGDYITFAEVNASIASLTDAISVKDSSVANYKNIAIIATIENGQLTNMTLTYNFSASLDLSIGASGTGAAKITAEYSNFKY